MTGLVGIDDRSGSATAGLGLHGTTDLELIRRDPVAFPGVFEHTPPVEAV